LDFSPLCRDCAYFQSIVREYTAKGKAKYKAIYLKFTAKTMKITANESLLVMAKYIAHSTKPCIAEFG
jgi:hypothetical protein